MKKQPAVPAVSVVKPTTALVIALENAATEAEALRIKNIGAPESPGLKTIRGLLAHLLRLAKGL